MLPLLLAPLGCGPGTPLPAPAWEDAPVEIGGGGTDPVVEDAGGQEDSLDDWIFSVTTIHSIDLTLDHASIASLYADPYTTVRGGLTFDGEPLASIGVRLRGKIGSFRTLDGKPKFALDFNAFVPDQRFYGLESLSLDNSVVDCSYMKEVLGYKVFDLAGVPHQRTSFAWVRVNGADYGLYVVIETPDDRMLRRLYDEPSGNLYDGKYVWYGSGYMLLDFNSGLDAYFQLEEGTDVGNADIARVSATIAANAGGAFEAGMADVLDWDEYHRELAVEQWIGHLDGYALNTNNYRVYFDPADGRADIVPWDLDYAFLYDYQWGMSWGSPRGQITYWCWQDAACVESQRQAMAGLLAAVDPVALDAWFQEVAAVTWDASQADPRQECGAANVQPWRDYLRGWVASQNAAMASFWGL